jgi:fucose 4-O-acetylase-like acetyltransferase
MTRRFDLDWVRVLAFGLLVLYHVGMYYVTWDWHVKSPHSSPALEPFMLLSSPWRLGLLFLVSGAATSFLLRRRPQGFLGTRSRRLLVPLLFGMLVVVAPQAYYEVVEKVPGGYHDGYWAFYARYLSADQGFCRGDDCLILPTWNHLWFVAYLWVYTVVLWLAVTTLPQAWLARFRVGVARGLSGAGLILWPVTVLAIARLALVGRFESTHALIDDWYNHAQYLPLFLLGFAMTRMTGVWPALWRLRWTALALAAISYSAIAIYFTGTGFDDANPPPQALRMAMRVVWALNQWTAMAAILGFAWRFRDADGPVLRYLVPAVFPVYILHQTVTVVLAHHLKPVALSPAVEGPILVVGTFALCFAGYELIRRIGPLRPLFGLPWTTRPDRPASTDRHPGEDRG